MGVFRFGVHLSNTIRTTVIPRSGYDPKPRVASTLGTRVDILLNPERVAPVGRNRDAVELAIQFPNPGLPLRLPWVTD